MTRATFDLPLRLRVARHRAEMTQREAALRTGLDNGSISSWETGARVNSLTVANLMRLLVCYHIHPARFMADEYLTAEDWR